MAELTCLLWGHDWPPLRPAREPLEFHGMDGEVTYSYRWDEHQNCQRCGLFRSVKREVPMELTDNITIVFDQHGRHVQTIPGRPGARV